MKRDNPCFPHPLDDWPLIFQWVVALLLAGVAVILLGTVAFLAAVLLGLRWDSPFELGLALVAALLLLLPLWMLVCACLLAPLLRLTGFLRYYSPFLIVSRAGHRRLALHGAMPFDYVVLFRWCDRGRPAARRILCWYADGLLALAREIQEGRVAPGTEISATSYIFSGRTLRRFGFSVESASRLALGGFLTYPTQVLTYSFAQGRWSLPPLLRTCKATIHAAQLAARTDHLERLLERVQRTGAASQGCVG